MTWYELIKSYYQDWRVYTEEDVLFFVGTGVITQEEADEIINGKNSEE